jgi:hypothetical protein
LRKKSRKRFEDARRKERERIENGYGKSLDDPTIPKVDVDLSQVWDDSSSFSGSVIDGSTFGRSPVQYQRYGFGSNGSGGQYRPKLQLYPNQHHHPTGSQNSIDKESQHSGHSDKHQKLGYSGFSANEQNYPGPYRGPEYANQRPPPNPTRIYTPEPSRGNNKDANAKSQGQHSAINIPSRDQSKR